MVFKGADFDFSRSRNSDLSRYPFDAKSFQYYKILLSQCAYFEKITHVRAGTSHSFPCALSLFQLHHCFFRSSPPISTLSFQQLAHSFIFHIPSIPCVFNRFRTLVQKTGGGPPWSNQSLSAASLPPLFHRPALSPLERPIISSFTTHQPALSDARFLRPACFTGAEGSLFTGHWPLVASH